MDSLFYNGIIRTMDETNPIAEAIGITRDRITFIGTNEEAMKIDAKNKIDLNGKSMLPGFIEGHMHLCGYAYTNNSVMLFDCTSVEECVSTAKAYIKNHDGQIKGLYCRGWNEDKFDIKAYPTRQDLDSISTEIPIIMIRVCGHIGICNSIAFEKINQLEEAKALQSEMDFENGRLYEGACQLFCRILETPSKEYVKQLMKFGMEHLNKCGITCCQPDDFGSVPGADWHLIMSSYKDLEAADEMPVRIYQQCLFERFNEFQEFIALGNRTGQGGSHYQLGPLKLLQDGSLGAKTAALTKGYIDDGENHGVTAFNQDELDEIIIFAHKNNMQIAVHCIGDKAMDMVLNSIEKAQKLYPREDCRHGIVHVQITTKEIMKRMSEDNVIAYIQPVFIDYDMDIVESRIGADRCKDTYAWRTLNDLGVLTVGGSDAPIESFDVLDNIYYAVTREKLKGGPEGGWLPDQKVSVDDAVKMFTTHGAKACFNESNIGMLKSGMYADMVILNEDIYTIEPHHIKDVDVLCTICGGKVVYQK